MRIPRVFVSASLNKGDVVDLDSENSRYLVRVLRRQTDDPVTLFNGDGNDYLSSIASTAGKTSLRIESVQANSTESPLKITLVQSLAKGAKLDLVVQKATELGVHAIAPVSNERSILQIAPDKQARKLDHWRKIAVSACAQCNRSVVPQIEVPQTFEQWLSTRQSDTTFLLDPDATQGIGVTQAPAAGSCTLVVGPEGGFSQDERDRASAHGVLPVCFGPRVLRTETAGLAAIAVLQALFGDLCADTRG